MSRSGLARACALAALLAAVATACGGDDEPDAPASGTSTTTAVPTSGGEPTATATTTTAPAVRVIEVDFEGGRVTGGVRSEKVPLGETVLLRVTSDVADEVHVHTYDLVADVAPGRPAEIEVEATIPGRHEVELEDRGRAVLTLEVS